jgi:hypothetical protein
MMKKFVLRESTRENGSIERAYEICKDANKRKIGESKKELSNSSNFKKQS